MRINGVDIELIDREAVLGMAPLLDASPDCRWPVRGALLQRRGGTVRIRDREGEFLFTAVGARRHLLGSARGKIRFEGDLTRPTLPDDAWKPSL